MSKILKYLGIWGVVKTGNGYIFWWNGIWGCFAGAYSWNLANRDE